jgi:hypothetical protein
MVAAFFCCLHAWAASHRHVSASSTTARPPYASAHSRKHHLSSSTAAESRTTSTSSSKRHSEHQTSAASHSGQLNAQTASGRHGRHSTEAVAAEPSGRAGHWRRGLHGSHEPHESQVLRAKEENKQVLVTVRDKHGRPHKAYRQVTVHEEQHETHKHTETKHVAVMVRDRHGRLHKVFRSETVTVVDEAPRHSASKTAAEPAVASKQGKQAKSGESNKNEEVTATKDDNADYRNADEPERLNPSYGKAYALYDEGANARISGNYPLAISCLGRALSMVPANSHGGPSVLQLNMEYELAQSAESKGDLALAARYYSRAVADRPNFTEAAVRLCTVLARAGSYTEALKAAKAAVQRSPNDPRTHAILAVILEKTGSADEARAEKMKTKSLMANIHSIDTAPLVSPDAVSPETNQPVKTGEEKSEPSMSPGPSTDSDVP